MCTYNVLKGGFKNLLSAARALFQFLFLLFEFSYFVKMCNWLNENYVFPRGFDFRYENGLVNGYLDGTHQIGYHKDDDIDPRAPVFSLTFYDNSDRLQRKFSIRPRRNNDERKFEAFLIPDCSLIGMAGFFQQHFKHAILQVHLFGNRAKNKATPPPQQIVIFFPSLLQDNTTTRVHECPDCNRWPDTERSQHRPEHYARRISITFRVLASETGYDLDKAEKEAATSVLFPTQPTEPTPDEKAILEALYRMTELSWKEDEEGKETVCDKTNFLTNLQNCIKSTAAAVPDAAVPDANADFDELGPLWPV